MGDEGADDWRLILRTRGRDCANVNKRKNRGCRKDASSSERRLTQEARAGISVRVWGCVSRVLMLKRRTEGNVGGIERNDWRRRGDEAVVVVDVCLRDETLHENGNAAQKREKAITAIAPYASK